LVSRQLKADLALLFIVFIWGTTFAIMKDIFTVITPFYFLTLRFGFASIALGLILYRQLSDVNLKLLKQGMIAGVLLFGGYAFQVVGLNFTTASKAGFITGLSVVLVPIFAVLFFRRLPPLLTWIGVSLAAVGLWLLTFSGSLEPNLGDWLVLVCAACLALHILVVDKYVKSNNPLLLALIQISTVAVLSALGAGLEGSYQLVGNTGVWISVLYMGVLATALAFVVQNKAQTFTTPERTAIIFSMEPVFGALFAYLYLGEVITVKGYIGGALIILSMLLVEMEN